MPQIIIFIKKDLKLTVQHMSVFFPIKPTV